MLIKHLTLPATVKLALAAPYDHGRDPTPAGTPTVWYTAIAAATALTESSSSDVKGKN